MYVVKKDEFFKNVNTDYGIPVEIQKKLMNGNAQFIMDLAINLKMSEFSNLKNLHLDFFSSIFRKSYSITSIAIHLCHFFFYKRSYLNYDRFVIIKFSI